jgi:hypothetical protein
MQQNASQLAADKTFTTIDNLLRSSNQSLLKNAKTLAVFTRNSGLTRSYKIFYTAKDGSVVEADVNNDIFRGKNYILSVFTLIQRSN